MSTRFMVLCNNSTNNTNNSQLSADINAYRKQLAALEKTRINAVAACNAAYKQKMTTVVKTNSYYNYIQSENIKIEKDVCVNNAYTAFLGSSSDINNAMMNASNTAAYIGCITGPLVTDWDWSL